MDKRCRLSRVTYPGSSPRLSRHYRGLVMGVNGLTVAQGRRVAPRQTMNARSRPAWLAFALLGAAPAVRAAGYGGGSLIIPTQSSYQDDCGVASAYGLVYNVLRANDGLAAIGKTRITVHWAYKATKGSPNRCVPTDIQNPPVYGSYTTSNPPPWNDAIWNDGCDFRVTDNTSVPVKLEKHRLMLAASEQKLKT